MKEALSARALVQYLAIHCIGRGGCRYWTSVKLAPKNRVTRRAVDPGHIISKLQSKYDTELSRYQRVRRKHKGNSTVRSVQFDGIAYLLATPPLHGHSIFEEEQMLDLRDYPIHIAGHSITIKRGVDGKWHGSVRISRNRFLEIRSFFLENATKWNLPRLEQELRSLPYERFEPVKWQLQRILKQINVARRKNGLEPLEQSCVLVGRKPIKVFKEAA